MLNYVNHLIKTNPYIAAFKFQYFAIYFNRVFLIKKNEYSVMAWPSSTHLISILLRKIPISKFLWRHIHVVTMYMCIYITQCAQSFSVYVDWYVLWAGICGTLSPRSIIHCFSTESVWSPRSTGTLVPIAQY